MGCASENTDRENLNVYKKDVEAFRNGTFRLETAASLASWTTRAGLTHKVEGGTVGEFSRIVKQPIYEKWLSMAKSSECSELLFTGASLGDAMAQLARIDVGDIDAAGRYTGTCFGKPCRYIGLMGFGPFYGQPEDLPQMANGCSAENNGEKSFYYEGDLITSFLNVAYCGGKDFPDVRADMIQYGVSDPEVDPTDRSPEWRRAVPLEVIREFRKLCGVRHGELRRDLTIPLVGAPRPVVYWQDVACDSSMWDFYYSQSFKDREAAINHGPLAQLTKRKTCPMRASCGHTDNLDTLLMVDFIEDVSDAKTLSIPMPPGSILNIAYYATRVPNAILQTLLDE